MILHIQFSKFFIKQQWDYTQRKVVRYDYSNGDKEELPDGHGTKVAGAAAGSAINDKNDKANGVAQGSKLHVFDIMERTGMCMLLISFCSQHNRSNQTLNFQFVFHQGGYNMPTDLAYRLFESMHDTDKLPARVAVGSFNTRFRPYPFSCKFFDEALHGRFKGDLYVASAGNDGLDNKSLRSKDKTIGNPASCKNTMAGETMQRHGSYVFII